MARGTHPRTARNAPRAAAGGVVVSFCGMGWTRAKVAAVVAVVGVSFVTGRITAHDQSVTFVADAPGYMVVAGAIRPDADCKWRLIDDDAHAPVGIEQVTTDTETGTVTVEYGEVGSEVVTFVASPDETLAAAGVEVGASVSLDRAVLRTSPFDCATIGKYANVWVYGLIKP